jgi:hypothetical protein
MIHKSVQTSGLEGRISRDQVLTQAILCKLLICNEFTEKPVRPVGQTHFLTIALRALTFIEFQVRQGLKAEGQSLKGIYAGQKGRQSMRPSTELLLDGFKEINAVVGKVKGEFFVLLDPLSEAQKRILRLLRLDDDLYQNFL